MLGMFFDVGDVFGRWGFLMLGMFLGVGDF